MRTIKVEKCAPGECPWHNSEPEGNWWCEHQGGDWLCGDEPVNTFPHSCPLEKEEK